MQFVSLTFLIFFQLAVLLFWAVPARLRAAVLLGLSWYFVFTWGLPSLWTLLAVTGLTYLAGRGIAAAKSRGGRRVWLVVGLASSAGYVFAAKAVLLAAPAVSLISAVGVAFYALQAAGYLADVYTGKTAVEKKFVRYAAYVSFFPRLVSGPIGRAGTFFPQLDAAVSPAARFDPDAAVRGLKMMLWGYMEKLVIAATLGTLVDTVYGSYAGQGGVALLAAVVGFAFQLYADFSGYSHIAIGAAQVLGFALSPNFCQPYLAQDFSDFWRRWHISLSSWLRDYLYIPLGGNRKGRARKYLNLMLTFLASGLWHGTGWQYLLWGGLHGTYQIAQDAWHHAFGPRKHQGAAARWLRRLGVFLLVDLAWLFFRAPSVGAGLQILYGIFARWHTADLWNGTLFGLGVSRLSGLALFAAMAVWLGANLLRGGALPAPAGKACPRALVWAFWLLTAVAAAVFAVRGLGGGMSFYYARF